MKCSVRSQDGSQPVVLRMAGKGLVGTETTIAVLVYMFLGAGIVVAGTMVTAIRAGAAKEG